MADPEILAVWPSAPPGTESWTHEEIEYAAPFADQPDKQWRGIRNVTQPSMTVYRPTAGRANGAGVVVCPGGGFHLLAYDYEGVDIAEWFAARGVTAFLLKYRVEPTPADPAEFADFGARMAMSLFSDLPRWRKTLLPAQERAIADGCQALKVIRERAAEFGVEPGRVGMIGFSAGAGLTLGVAQAEPADRPSFAVAVYGGDHRETPIDATAPPLFLVVSENDPFQLAADNIRVYQRWIAGGASADLHIFSEGGHGYGMRQLGMTTDQWPDLLERWLRKLKVIAGDR